MKKYKKNLNISTPLSPTEDDEDKVDFNSYEVVAERVMAGLIGNLRIDNDTNKPIFKPGDYVQIRKPSKVLPKDFVLYQNFDDYFLRRVVKFKDDDIYVAGDNESQFRIIKKENIIGKVVSRERKNKRLSFSLTPKKKLYTFKKYNLSYLRIRNRVIHYEQEVNLESLELAAQAVQESKSMFENKSEIKYNIDLDSELSTFLNPDTLVLELKEAMTHSTDDQTAEEDSNDSQSDDEIVDTPDETEEVIYEEEESETEPENGADNELDESSDEIIEDNKDEDASEDELKEKNEE